MIALISSARKKGGEGWRGAGEGGVGALTTGNR